VSHPCFDANQFPLTPGCRLLEASAGTGKTFALAHLVLRLLSEGDSPLQVEQLLVVTFTEAAAAELSDRIAQRLQEALRLIEMADGSAADQPLQDWFTQQNHTHHRRLEGRLLLALERLDRADITTIHGFCRRTLQRQALEAGLGPAVALETQGHERREQVVHDYWQQQVLPLPPALLAGLQERGIQPDNLMRVLAALDGDPSLRLDPPPAACGLGKPLTDQLCQFWEQCWQSFLQHWHSDSKALEDDFAAAATELKSFGAPYAPYRLKAKPDRLNRVQAWIDGLSGTTPSYEEVLAQADLQKYFHPGPFTKVSAAVHGDQVSLPQHDLLKACAALVDAPAEMLLLHFGHWGRRELELRRQRSGRISFGQLLEQLDPCTKDPDAAPAPSPLLDRVAQRYRAALIDEFQDTDPMQWRILARAFGGDPCRHLLVIVGDPKQAIYRFRGGALETYRLAATAATECFGLYDNRRSSAPLVEALNQLMAPGLVRTGLTVPAVAAKANKGMLTLPEEEHPLQLLPLDRNQADQQVAALCHQLLERGLQLVTPDGSRPLEPGDICVLVGQHTQAEGLRGALERRQLPSRLVSKGDVFATPGAAALQRCLDALAQPGHSGRQRLLAASPLLGWSAADLEQAEPARWDQLATLLGTLAERLPRIGLTAVLTQLQGSEAMAQLSLRGRVLADLQQAAELVQEQMHRQGLGALQAADWLRRQRLQDQGEVPDAHLCRSDAAESAIAVVTVHRSKGLEYPVVICPYLWKGSKTIKADARRIGRRWTPPHTGEPHLDLHLNPHWGQGRLAAQQDHNAQAAEAERLAYVACTRARHLLVLGWPEDDDSEAGNPLSAWLTQPEGERDRPLHRIDLDASQLPQLWQPPPPSGELELGPRPERSLDSRWGRASYSAWAHSQREQPPEMREDGRDTDALSSDQSEASPSDSSSDESPTITAEATTALNAPESDGEWLSLGPLAHFPRGAGPGDALHKILEQIDYHQLAEGDDSSCRRVIATELPRAGLDPALSDALLDALMQLVQTPFGGALGPCRLGDLKPGEWLNEMNFDLPLAQSDGLSHHLVRSSGMAQVFNDHPGGLFNSSYSHELRQLEFASRGFLTGSIDLVFRWQERWWVADWKSNWLGQRDGQGTVLQCGPQSYTQEAMEQLMVANHYPLQAHLYAVALHRYLQWRLPNYSPEAHLGGYAYVFLRGVPGAIDQSGRSPQAPTPGVLVDQPSLARVLALDALLREGQP